MLSPSRPFSLLLATCDLGLNQYCSTPARRNLDAQQEGMLLGAYVRVHGWHDGVVECVVEGAAQHGVLDQGGQLVGPWAWHVLRVVGEALVLGDHQAPCSHQACHAGLVRAWARIINIRPGHRNVPCRGKA